MPTSAAQPDSELVRKLLLISGLRGGLSRRDAAWVGVTGLGVHLVKGVLGAYPELLAGDSTLRPQFILRFRDDKPGNEGIEYRKYVPGEWEHLVDPTLQVALLVAAWGASGGHGITPEKEVRLKAAVETFRSSGVWRLEVTEDEAAMITQLTKKLSNP